MVRAGAVDWLEARKGCRDLVKWQPQPQHTVHEQVLQRREDNITICRAHYHVYLEFGSPQAPGS
jgi:hypothetical protein